MGMWGEERHEPARNATSAEEYTRTRVMADVRLRAVGLLALLYLRSRGEERIHMRRVESLVALGAAKSGYRCGCAGGVEGLSSDHQALWIK
jgi:hypothetical protein